MKRLLPLACFLPALLMGLVALGLTGGYAVNVTPSLERGIYKASTASPSRGDIVGFCLDGAGAHLAAERAYLAPGSCTSGLRPLLKYLAGMPGDVVTVTPDDCVVIMTRGHQADYEVLTQVLRSGARYIGCIGSRKKLALCRDKLLAAGFTEAEYACVHAPIGLAIGAVTPAEIAVSVCAQLVQWFHSKE